jgi:hypothetical protein
MSDIHSLIKLLQSDNANERRAACKELRVSPSLPDEALQALRVATQDKNPGVAEAAQRALATHAQQSSADLAGEKEPGRAMTEPKEKHHWLTRLSVIGASAIIGAFGSAFLSLFVLVVMWGGIDSASVGVVWGPPIGFLVGGGMAVWLSGKQGSIWRVMGLSIVVAFLTSSLWTAILGLSY